MQPDAKTKESHTERLAVRAVSVEVVEGVNAGKTASARDERLSVGSAEGNDLVLTDTTVSRYHLELRRIDGGIEVRDHRSTNGTWLGERGPNALRIHHAVVTPGTSMWLGDSRILIRDAGGVTVPIHAGDTLCGLRSESQVMRRLLAEVRRGANSDASVLIVGESGTGKELVARAVHELGPRTGGPFVTIDCAALAPNLVASELFGHERGAFTGADRRHVGAFERADGGTLFLDEIGELPNSLQATLLGALERRSFRPVGGNEERSFDARVLAATHRDLREEVNTGAFRLDLYYRLAVVTLTTPPLRERPEDIPLLLEHFLRDAGFVGDLASLFPSESLVALSTHSFPGNVRELRNVAEAAVAMGVAPALRGTIPGDDESVLAAFEQLVTLPYKDAKTRLLGEFERRYLEDRLNNADGNVSRAARDAGMNRSYFIELLARHGIR